MQIKELIKVDQPSSELFKWFHPDDADEIIEYNGRKLLVYGMADGSLLGFEHQGGDILKLDSYMIYEVILS